MRLLVPGACFVLQVATCDVKGKPRQFERELLFSKVGRVADLAKHLCEATKVKRPALVSRIMCVNGANDIAVLTSGKLEGRNKEGG